MHPSFTLEEAFGREEYEYEDGMSVTELLDSTNARLVYFPSYACTSFFVRDTMNHIFMTNADRLSQQNKLSAGEKRGKDRKT